MYTRTYYNYFITKTIICLFFMIFSSIFFPKSIIFIMKEKNKTSFWLSGCVFPLIFLVGKSLSVKKCLPYSIVQENQPNLMNRYKDLKNLRIGSFFYIWKISCVKNLILNIGRKKIKKSEHSIKENIRMLVISFLSYLITTPSQEEC